MAKDSVDKLSMDILDDDFVQIFKPIHMMQYLLGTMQVKIKYGFVTTTSYGYDVFCIVVWLIHIMSLFIFIVYCDSSTDSILTDFYLKLGHTLNGLIIATVTIKNFCNGNSSSQLYVKLQKIDRELYATRNNIKRILLLLEVKKKISIYDIYNLDSQLPLNLVAITATYTIVLLQFALLR
ncbi:uncharacterized protein LOC123721025 [Papilio machaon]|uniref:uncharacterized protein LOC123721025 n=1 Tax=Papilio machaon TaxID=76193 RepID=UPI001E663591|nr:uncharacterized protein LOC123721025 [Papilio machaon]